MTIETLNLRLSLNAFMYRKAYYLWLLTGMLSLIHNPVFGQTPGYEQDDLVKVAGITADNNSQIDNLPLTQRQTTIQYYDGLGRTVQTIAEQASPLQHDMIQPAAYDNLGRQTTGYLPYADETGTGGTGVYRVNAIITDQPNFYNKTSQYLVPTDGAPYNQAVFENSPLQRLLNAGMTGSGFQPGVAGNHYKTVSYRSNTTADGNIPVWNPDGTFTPGNYYAVNRLPVTDGVDEAGSETLVFTDVAGHTILKRQKMGTNNVDTYYLYNNAGMVSYIVPPAAWALMVSSSNYNANQTGAVSTLLFIFKYDTMGRLIDKTVPAKGTMSIVYDPLNRPVLMQDANLYTLNEWNYIRYDAKGRAVSQGIYTDANSGRLGQAAMQTYVNGLTVSYQTAWYETRNTVLSTGYFTAAIFPTASTGTLTPLAFAYFDNYTLTSGETYTYADKSLPGEANDPVNAAPVKGMPTMVRSVPTGSGITAATVMLKVSFYDWKLNPMQVQSNNQLYYTAANVITDYSTVIRDFSGVPQVTLVSKQSAASITTTVQTMFSYDQVNRLIQVSQQYNKSGSMLPVAAYTYSEAGQVIKKGLGYVNSTTWLQNVDMRYNIRGQLLYINNSTLTNDGGVTNSDSNDLFGMAFLYDQAGANSLGNTPCYNGDVSSARWMSRDNNGVPTNERAYNYTYDQLNRYTAAAYGERMSGGSNFSSNANAYNETIGYTADNSGNILSLNRNGPVPAGSGTFGAIDQLSYTYTATSPGQLHTVTDASADSLGFYNHTGLSTAYLYDTNGNLTHDYYKGISLAYNVLNRTNKIAITTATNTSITYTYDAAGNVLRKQQFDNSTTATYTTDYIDGFVYINGTLAYFPMPEGRVTDNAGTLTQEFIITDQQGNARLSFNNSGIGGTAKVVQENSYYGTGLAMTPIVTGSNKKLYNGGSEWQNDYNKLPDYYQAFYRNYDAAIARFVGVDPMADGAESMTDYQYAGNNPIMMNDPLGDQLKIPVPPIQVNFGNPSDLNDGGGSGVGNNDPYNDIGRNVQLTGGGEYSNFWQSALSFLGDVSSAVNGSAFSDVSVSPNQLGHGAVLENAFSLGLIAQNSPGGYYYTAAGIQNMILNGPREASLYRGGVSTDNADQGGRLEFSTPYGGGVLVYSEYFGPNPDNSNDKSLWEGESVDIYFTSITNHFKSFQWIQTVFQTFDGNSQYLVDGGALFYYNQKELDESTVIADAYFGDTPSSTGYLTRGFSGVTTLVGISSNGSLTPIITFTWGFQYIAPSTIFLNPVSSSNGTGGANQYLIK